MLNWWQRLCLLKRIPVTVNSLTYRTCPALPYKVVCKLFQLYIFSEIQEISFMNMLCNMCALCFGLVLLGMVHMCVQNTITGVRWHAQSMRFKSMFPNWSTHFPFITSETGKGNGIGCNILDMFPLFHSQLIARMQDSYCKQAFVEWRVG